MNTPRIDTHHHVVPPTYAAWLASQGIDAGGRAIPDWTAETALALMDSIGVERAILSVSTPGVHLGDDALARRWAREVNEFAARQRADQPGRFGFFATLTLPDVDG
ncbi:MAG: amidohydrolase, partial [Ottowia sp.]|nr:amidohydrolase [Ottowia sp.]